MSDTRILLLSHPSMIPHMRHLYRSSAVQVALIDVTRVHVCRSLSTRRIPALLKTRTIDNVVTERIEGWNLECWQRMLMCV